MIVRRVRNQLVFLLASRAKHVWYPNGLQYVLYQMKRCMNIVIFSFPIPAFREAVLRIACGSHRLQPDHENADCLQGCAVPVSGTGSVGGNACGSPTPLQSSCFVFVCGHICRGLQMVPGSRPFGHMFGISCPSHGRAAGKMVGYLLSLRLPIRMKAAAAASEQAATAPSIVRFDSSPVFGGM